MDNKEVLKEMVGTNVIVHDILKLMNKELKEIKRDAEFNVAFMCINIVCIYILLFVFSIKYYYS